MRGKELQQLKNVRAKIQETVSNVMLIKKSIK